MWRPHLPWLCWCSSLRMPDSKKQRYEHHQQFTGKWNPKVCPFSMQQINFSSMWQCQIHWTHHLLSEANKSRPNLNSWEQKKLSVPTKKSGRRFGNKIFPTKTNQLRKKKQQNHLVSSLPYWHGAGQKVDRSHWGWTFGQRLPTSIPSCNRCLAPHAGDSEDPPVVTRQVASSKKWRFI